MPDGTGAVTTAAPSVQGVGDVAQGVRSTQQLVEVYRGEPSLLRATQAAVEVSTFEPHTLRHTQQAVEYGYYEPRVLRTTHHLVEFIHGQPARIRETQELVEIFRRRVPGEEPIVPLPTIVWPMRRLRRSPHLSADGLWAFYQRFQLDLEAGVGLIDGQGEDPQLMLRWSDDGGHTWSDEHWTTAGRLGAYAQRAIWRRLGRSRDRIFEVTISDPVKVAWIGAWLDVESGRH